VLFASYFENFSFFMLYKNYFSLMFINISKNKNKIILIYTIINIGSNYFWDILFTFLFKKMSNSFRHIQDIDNLLSNYTPFRIL